MTDWKVFYRDNLDHDRISPGAPSKEAALRQARNLYRDRRAEIYRIEGPAGWIVPKEEVMRWVAANKW
jgi:1,2-phenylacetyl-CoA epoxidase PaaB subunit